MFAPLELGFGVDATLSVEFLANREARRLLAKRKIDADQIAREEASGDHGPSVEAAERPHLARELEAVLGGGDRPPLLALGAAALGRRPRRERAGGTGRAPARVLRPGAAAPPRRRAAPPLPRLAAGHHLSPARVQGAPAARPARGDGPARDLPRRLGDRPLHRPHADRLALAGPVRPRRGLPAEPPADLPAWSAASARARRSASSSPPGRPSCRARGRSSTSTPRAIITSTACPASPSGSRRSSSPARSATAACSTRCGSAPRRPARTSPTTSSSRSCRRRSSPSGRPSCASRSPRPRRPAPRNCAEILARLAASDSAEAIEVGRAIEVHGQAGLAKLGLGAADSELPERRRRPGRLAADPQPHPAAGRHRALGAARGGADQPRGPAPAGRLRAAALRLGHRRATRCWRWTRPGR